VPERARPRLDVKVPTVQGVSDTTSVPSSDSAASHAESRFGVSDAQGACLSRGKVQLTRYLAVAIPLLGTGQDLPFAERTARYVICSAVSSKYMLLLVR
jgi:hypothetical protein